MGGRFLERQRGSGVVNFQAAVFGGVEIRGWVSRFLGKVFGEGGVMSGQMRRHLRFGVGNYWRLFWEGRRLGACGAGVYIDRDVELMRYPQNIEVGEQAVLKEGARICACNEVAQIRIGARTTIGYHTFIFASERVEIGADCLIAPFVYIVDSDHGIERGIKINGQPNQTAPIIIGDDVWVGTHVQILKGVRIGEGAVVAAGSLVRRDILPNQIVGGVPARVLGER